MRVDGFNKDGKWKNAVNDKLDFPFPSKLDFSKDEGDGYSLMWNSFQEKLLGSLDKKKKSAFVCVESCQEPTLTTSTTDKEKPQASDGSCGKGWVQLKDKEGTCIR